MKDIPIIDTILMQSQIRGAGHVVRMADHSLPKLLFYCELEKGKRSQGGQKKCFKDTLKTSLPAFSINSDTWEVAAMDQTAWRSYIHTRAVACEKPELW